jgi:hypothetical protein
MKRAFSQAKPLSQARVDSTVIAHAALFVEELFGRPLRNDPIIIHARTWHRAEINTLRIDPNFDPSTAVHELVHSEDLYPQKASWDRMSILGKIKHRIKASFNLPWRMWLEGRAEFARHLFEGGTSRFDENFRLLISGGICMAAGTLIGAVASAIQNRWLSVPSALFTSVGVLLADLGALYWLFNNVLCTLAEKAGDSVAAFRLSTDKLPTWQEILQPSRYCERVMKGYTPPEAAKGTHSFTHKQPKAPERRLDTRMISDDFRL